MIRSNLEINYGIYFTAGLPPKLHGVSNDLSKATSGGKVWNDKDDTFGNLPSFIDGGYVFQTPARVYRDVVMIIVVYQPSTIYVSSEAGGRSGGFGSSLPNDGWVLQEGTVHTSCCILSQIWKKIVTNKGMTTITLPVITTGEMVGSIFVKGNTSKFQNIPL